MSDRFVRTWWVLFWLVALTIAVQAAHESLHAGGHALDSALGKDGQLLSLGMLAALVLARAAAGTRERAPWLLIGLGLATYTAGDAIWRFAFAGREHPPWPSWADAAWMLWFPLALAGMVLLARERIPRRHLGLWMDGIAVALLVAIPSVALVLEPVIHHSHENALGNLVLAAYPLGDIVILGAAIAALAMTGWRPGRAWLVLSAGLVVFVVVDCVYAVQSIEGTYRAGVYDWLWPLGALLVGAAAMVEPVTAPEHHVFGFKAIALGVLCQVVAIGTQIYGIEHALPHSERVLTIGVLLVIVVQIVNARPRPPGRIG